MAKADLKIEDGKVGLPDGRMHYVCAGEGPAVILMHNMTGSLRSWLGVLERLAAARTVYALDAMGQGDSDKPGRDYLVADYARSVIAFMDAKGIKRATLVGNSGGAVTAVELAASYPGRVDRMVLVGCPCLETEEARREMIENSKRRYDANLCRLPRTLEDMKNHYLRPDPEIQAKINEDAVKAGPWAWKCTVASFSYDIVPALKRIKAPTLVLFGEKDKLRAHEGTLLGSIAGARLALVPDSAHLPHEENPAGFLEAVGPFLAG